MTQPLVSIVILNWDGWKDTIECLESIYQINYTNYNVIVVDNNSEDNSVKEIEKYIQGKTIIESTYFVYNTDNKPLKNITIIENEQNIGFAAGNNVGIRYALDKHNPEYVLLLNNDTVVDKNFLDEAIEPMERNFDIGIVTSKIYFYNRPNTIWAAGGRILNWTGSGRGVGNNKKDVGQFNDNKEVEYAPGTMMLIRKSVFRGVGLLPECYLATGEEMEFAIKAKYYDYKILCIPKSIIYHKVGMSSDTSPKYVYNSWRTRLLYVERNLPGLYWKLLSSLYIVIHMSIKTFVMFDSNELKCFMMAYKDHKCKKTITESDVNKAELYFMNKMENK